jgi:hypothetical protein
LEVEVRVPPLGIHQHSLKARFTVRLEESEAAGVIKEAVDKVDRRIRGAERQAGGRERRKRERRTQRTSSGGTLLENERDQGERDGEAREGGRSEENSWEWRASRGFSQKASTTTS